MDQHKAQQIILEGVSVTRQKLIVMKELLSSSGNIDGALKHLDAARPGMIVLHADVDALPQLKRASDWLSYTLAGCEAMWDLVHAGVLIMVSNNVTSPDFSLNWTTVHGRSGGESAGWRFDNFRSSYPSNVTPSNCSDRDQIFADGDLFLTRLAVPDLHVEIQDALRDAVRCLRTELLTPCVLMLGKASEGAWIELGVTLAAVVADAKAQKFAQELVGPDIGFAKKLREIITFIETRQAIFKPVADRAGVTLHDLRTAMLWSDTLRDARNAIHHRVPTTPAHTYETVTTLMLAAIPHLRTIYALYVAARGAAPAPVAER